MTRAPKSRFPRVVIYSSIAVFSITMTIIYLSRAHKCTAFLETSGWSRTGYGFTKELACKKAIAHCSLFAGRDQICKWDLK